MQIKVDTTEFDKVFKEYMDYSDRTNTEACNQHAYYIARNAVLLTKGADKGVIQNVLSGPSRDYPDVPLAAILVNAQLGKAGEKGLSGAKMASAVQKFIKKSKGHVNFLRSGWIPAIKLLEGLVAKKRGSRIPRGTAKSGRTYGGATPARNGKFNPIATIWSSIEGSKKHGDKSDKVHALLEKGAQKAVDMETESMRKYIQGKQDEICKRVWK